MKTQIGFFLILAALFVLPLGVMGFFYGCSVSKPDQATRTRVICQNEKGEVVLQAVAIGEIRQLLNGSYRFLDANGKKITIKANCQSR